MTDELLPRDLSDLLLKRAAERLDKHDDNEARWLGVAREVANEHVDYSDAEEAERIYQQMAIMIRDSIWRFHAMRRDMGLSEHP